jgi:hypothetical protein
MKVRTAVRLLTMTTSQRFFMGKKTSKGELRKISVLQ